MPGNQQLIKGKQKFAQFQLSCFRCLLSLQIYRRCYLAIPSAIQIIMILFLIMPHTQYSTFLEFRQEMQHIVKQISMKMEEHYAKWCENGTATCQTPSVNGCLGVVERTCDRMFPKPIICLFQGQYISNYSTIKLPREVDPNNLNQQVMKFVCSSAKLQTTFQQLSKNRNLKFTSMYFGSKHGMFRSFPGYYHGLGADTCDQYDPRQRPWYTIAASGAKNVIILLDKSYSMQAGNFHFQTAKQAVKSVIETLTISDNVGVIAFDNYTQIIGNSFLSKATNQYKERLKGYVDQIKNDKGQTNFWKAFQEGLNMVNNAIKSGDSGCIQAQNAFLLLTDGNPTQNSLRAQQLIKNIKNFTDNTLKKSIVIFAYALGQKINTQYLKKLSCSFKGIVISSQSQFSSNSAIPTKLQQFYTYFSVGVNFKNPIWTQPYNDYFGYGRMVTISMPAYYTNPSTNLTTLIGVAGVDIIMSHFDNYGYSEQDIIIQLIGQGACQKNSLTDCQVQMLRSQKYRCNITGCDFFAQSNQSKTKCENLPQSLDIYSNQHLIQTLERCCGITLNTFIAIIVTCGVVLLIFGLVFWKRKWLKLKFCSKFKRNISKKQRRHHIRSATMLHMMTEQSNRKQSWQLPQSAQILIKDDVKDKHKKVMSRSGSGSGGGQNQNNSNNAQIQSIKNMKNMNQNNELVIISNNNMNNNGSTYNYGGSFSHRNNNTNDNII